jgi:hypothetical protein
MEEPQLKQKVEGSEMLMQSPQSVGRRLGRWDFEDGEFVELTASPNVETERALDMIETLVELRRKELAAARRGQAVEPAKAAPHDTSGS